MNRSLLAKIEQFLAERRESKNGGWAPVTSEDMTQLYEIIESLVELKWGSDADGDFPINYHLIDRTKHESHHCFNLPYLHKLKGDELLRYIDLAGTNVSMCMDRFKIALKHLEMEKADATRPTSQRK